MGFSVSKELFAPFGVVLSALTVTAILFNKFIWKWPLVNGWLVKRPNLNGTWKIVLHSDWINPKTGKGIASINGYLFIRQSFSQLSIRLTTKESASESISSAFKAEDDGTLKLASVYRNVPKAKVRDRSEIHHGTLLLSIGFLDEKIEGEYWTDRNSKGSIELIARDVSLYNSFDEAEKKFHEKRVALR